MPARRGARRFWRLALAAACCAAAAAGWQWTRPVLADRLAEAMPPALASQLGQGILQELDLHALRPSELSQLRQARIGAAFAGLQAPHEGAPRHRLLFRSASAGATAFALPSGDIILTDALVLALPDDGAVLAVLAHELGHLQHRHMLPRLMQEAMLPAAASLLAGDPDWLASRVAARAPQLALGQQAEIDADKYAADLLEHNGLSLRVLEEAPRALSTTERHRDAYLALHPFSGERQAHLRERAGH
jgi:Zn-dependent protease with chaperone function